MRPTASLVVVACFALSHAAAAQPEPKAPLDPERVVAQFRKAYHKRAFVESLDVTVKTAAERKRESVTVRGSREGELRLDLGDLTIWTEGTRLLAVHRLSAGTYFEAPLDPADRAASMLGTLPPLPIPQIALVLQPQTAPAVDWTVSPLCREPAWEKATATHQSGKPAVVLEGSDKGVKVRVAGVGDPPVIVFADTASTHDGVTTTISSEVTRLDEPVGRLACDLRGRERVEHLTDLRAQTPDMRPGLAMPEIIAEPLIRPAGERGRSPAVLPQGRACVLIMFSTAPGEGVERAEAFAAAAAEAARSSPAALRVLAVRSIADSAAGGTIERFMRKVSKPGHKDNPVCFVSYSPPTTLARFAPTSESRAVAIVIESSGLVQAVVADTEEAAAEKLRTALEALPE